MRTACAVVDFAALPLWVNVATFAGAASLVWLARVRLTAYAKIIADRTGAQQAFIGVLLIGAVVSLPELATTIAAASLGNARLAVNTLLGGIAATIVILAVTDASTGREPLSTDISHPIVLLQGILAVLFLAIAAAAIVVGDAPLAGVGMWTTALLAFTYSSSCSRNGMERANGGRQQIHPPVTAASPLTRAPMTDGVRSSRSHA